MTVPAGPDIGDGSDGPARNSDVTIHAIQLNILDVDVVWECDRLHRLGPVSKKMGYSL
jgi:hypothetical protein